MNELLKLDENGNQTVSARELHASLEVGRDFSNWIKDRIEKYGFAEGKDYKKNESPNLAIGDIGHSGGKPSINYFLTLSMAKEIAMVENNEAGRRIRQYLIKVEEAWNEPAIVMARALQLADKQIKLKEARIAELEPKAAFYDQVADSKDAIEMRNVAAVLNIQGLGRNKLFTILREKKVFDDDNIPYRVYQDRGYFRVIEKPWFDSQGETHIVLVTLTTQRGLEFIRRLVAGIIQFPVEQPA
jgi:anti-repressor protein